MYPVLLDLGKFTLNTYDVMWFAALSLAILWSVRRFPLYGFCSYHDDTNARKVIAWSFFVMLLGARTFEYIVNFRDYVDDPALLLNINHGSLSEIGAYCGAFIGAVLFCRRKKISFVRLCGVVALPAFLTMAIGRWGCFLNGCCSGIVTLRSTWSSVHFPRDATGVFRHPTQLYYSVSAMICLVGLWGLERLLVRREILFIKIHEVREFHDENFDRSQSHLSEKFLSLTSARGGIITSLGLMLLTAMRFVIDPLRAVTNTSASLDGFVLSHWVLLIALPAELIWLAVSLKRLHVAANSND